MAVEGSTGEPTISLTRPRTSSVVVAWLRRWERTILLATTEEISDTKSSSVTRTISPPASRRS
eukprot:scaffold67_cov180-Ochromonas_danica.AAC.11